MLDSTSRPGYSNGSDTPSEDEVRNHLEHLIASPDFEASARRRKFLRYLVEETLAGRGDKLKGYVIAIAVFERDKTFESQSDPVVRLEARRLRRDLDSYYMGTGNDDPVRIHIYKGSYIAHFESRVIQGSMASGNRETLPDTGRPGVTGYSGALGKIFHIRFLAGSGRSRFVTVAAFLAILAIAMVSYTLTGKEPVELDPIEGGPLVVVLPFESLGSSPSSKFLASGINQELIGNLMRFPGFRLYTVPVSGANGQYLMPAQLGRQLDTAYVISGSVQNEADDIHVLVKVQHAATGQVLWSGSYNHLMNPEAMIKAQLELAGKIAAEIGSPYGIVNTDLETQPYPHVSNMQSYICVLRAYQYRRNFALEEYKPVLECLEEAVRRDPEYSDSWAMLGWLHLDAGRYEFEGAGTTQQEYQKAFEAASRAIQMQPDNLLALKAMSSINHYLGHYEESVRLARRAVELNPYDPDTLAQLGWRLAARGNFEEGIPLLRKAIERTANPPGWYFHMIAIDLFLKGDYEQMRQVADHFSTRDSGIGNALFAIACSSIGDRKGTRAALQRMAEFKPIMRDPGAYIQRHGATDEIVAALTTGIAKAQQFANQEDSSTE